MVQGDINFQLNGQQWFGLDGAFDAVFEVSNNQPVLDVLFNAYLVIGSTSAPLIELNTEGFLQISSGGVAGELLASATLSPNVTQALAAEGLNLAPTDPETGMPVTDSFKLELNTIRRGGQVHAPFAHVVRPGPAAITGKLLDRHSGGPAQPRRQPGLNGRAVSRDHR